MNTVPGMVETIGAALARGEDVVLATVVKVENSAYRRPGARMLVCADGQHAGTVSGGCLEADIVRKAWWLTAGGAPVVCRYDTSAGAEAEWTFGLGCNGAVHILLEHVGQQSPQWHWLQEIALQRQPGACAVVIGRNGVSNLEIGQRLFVAPGGVRSGRLEDGSLQERIFADLAAVLAAGASRESSYQTEGGEVTFFLEVLAPPPHLVIFGAGHDAVPLVHMAAELGWIITVADARSHFARPARFASADQVSILDLDEVVASSGITRASAAVIMTHSYEQDLRILAQLLEVPPRYLGQLGPRSRTMRLLEELGARSKAQALVESGVLHYPVGLDIGAETPAEVALAILAEIKAALGACTGGMLVARDGAIHRDAALETPS
ncbi:xanthine/CO dehydrogenase XdhC/CoxF family maturation factor [Silvimonas terrae]|uniref:Xanthine/CO dehydrogenase XdhC/CoxF family maturation factor n=1 Tax=Silvimonas terrae TaxID=300266 RepID=A0A840RDL2_9NEIS|nr:XdhC/CoxI family protein [Silvimonas terrae]MBB5190618.1 xanthine/CO dehydrogenase XdhC/CoxF family maturation factor [Silvimonas terrae]